MADSDRAEARPSGDAARYLSTVGEAVHTGFERDRRILSFAEYLELFLANPRLQARNSAQYLKDVFDHFGAEPRKTAWGTVRRFRIFDLAGEGQGWVAGQEEAQNAIYRILGNFVRLGRVNKLVLLHGPNGSAKSSIALAIMRGMEEYSRRPEGALYRFNWVFPSERLAKGSLGFHEAAARAASSKDLDSFAHLEGEAIDARLACGLHDHPILLVPKAQRGALLEGRLARPQGREDDFVVSDYVLNGDLCHRCRQIFQALLGHYRGDYLKVLRHVQVERFYVDRRYQQSAVTVEPQMSVVDAGFRQVTSDRSMGNLPPALQNVVLFEPIGPLAHANRGVIEYSDLLKRPLEAFKYLLGTSENGQVPLDHFVLHLDQVLIASSNDKHLNAFKELPDFASFKGRIELVRVPYLRSPTVEKGIYDACVTPASIGRHVAPHATRVAAMWAVLTRLKKPIADRYQGELKELVDDLSPLEKLRLYDRGEVPDRLSTQQARELRRHLGEVAHESDTYPRYEGGAGASAREIKTALFNAAQSGDYHCLTPQAVLSELRGICRDKSVYEYLQQEVVDGFHDHEEFVRQVEAEYLDLVDEEVRDSLGLISEAQYQDLFERYVIQVSHWVKGEKVRNRVTGDYEKPSEGQMAEMEQVIMPKEEERGDFRRSLIGAIGAFRLDHPDDAVDYPRIFPDLFRRLRDHYLDERKRTLGRSSQNLLKYLSDGKAELTSRELAQAEEALEKLRGRHGYCDHCAKDALAVLIKRRYA